MLSQFPVLLKYLLLAGVVAFISLLCPNNVRFRYEFARGDTWHYEDLKAPFDFAILKTDTEFNQDLAEAAQDFAPYYRLDPEVESVEIRTFLAAFQEQLAESTTSRDFQDVTRNPQRYLNFGKDLLSYFYKRGIVELAPEHQQVGKEWVVNILRGNTTQRQTLERLWQANQVRGFLADTLPKSKLQESEFLYPLLEEAIVGNIRYDSVLTQGLRQELLESVPRTRSMVRKGEMIIPRGGIITDDIYQRLYSFKVHYEAEVTENKSDRGVYLGYVLLTLLVIGAFSIYLSHDAPEVFASIGKMIFVFQWLVIFGYLVYLVDSTDVLSTYLVPFAIVPIVIKSFYDIRLAFFTHLTVVLIASFLSSLGYEFTFLQVLAGIVIVLGNFDTRNWSRYFQAILYLFLAYGLGFLGLSLIRDGQLANVDWQVYSWLGLNAFLTLLAFPLIPLLERVFGFVSTFTLSELSDLNRPLLRDLAAKAPGTWQHSLQVGHLAEAAARRIGANHFLLRVAALYHDVGKMNNPSYFIENQSGTNPHAEVAFEDSARIIISHVTDGAEMARKNRVPKILIDFILTHHGTTRVEYFYRRWAAENPDQIADPKLFRYPGPKPRSKEEVILMLADSVEAACRSLPAPTEQELMDLVDKIVEGKVAHGQLQDSHLTFAELEACREVFRQVMKSVHHGRIAYPEQPANT